MELGFLLERGDKNRGAATQWVEGTPERSFWTGVRVKNRRVLPVITYRCDACGFLASYARPAGAS
jgi:DNA gyrase inhibitor GyrI